MINEPPGKGPPSGKRSNFVEGKPNARVDLKMEARSREVGSLPTVASGFI